MKTRLFFIFVVLTLLFGCVKNPFTGKSTLALVSNESILPMAFQEYSQFLSQNKVVSNTSEAQKVVTVGAKIKEAAQKWLEANGQKTYLDGYQWEYNLVEDPSINAWCMPGGKIVVYTGILPITKDEAGLATVMGHEVSHALANHGQQRMSAGILQQAGAVGVAIATKDKSESDRQMTMAAYAGISQIGVMLPFSRSHESEADKIGLTLMAIAGYNPEEAVAFWERMAASSKGNKPPELLSTHPSDKTRIENLRALIPIAKAEAAKFGVYYK